MFIISEMFINVIYSSAMASIAFIAVFVMNRLLSGKISGEWSYILWSIPLIRILFPCSFQSKLSIYNLFPIYSLSINSQKLVGNEPASNIKEPPIQSLIYSNSSDLNLIGALAFFWLFIALLAIGFILYFNMKGYSEFKKSKPTKNADAYSMLECAKNTMNIDMPIPIRESASISSPAIYGIVNPSILMPKGFFASVSPDSTKHILMHELAHHIRKDSFVNLILSIIQAIHWFNPLVHICFSAMRDDMEKACDELVFSNMKPVEIRSYGNTILECASLFSATSMCFARGFLGAPSKNSLTRKRILNLVGYMDFSHREKNALYLAVFLLASMIFLTEPVHSQKNPDFIYPDLSRTDFIQPINSKFSKFSPFKNGFNIECNTSLEPILAAQDGKVDFVGYDNERGKYIIITHSNGLSTLYSYCGEIHANPGDFVKKGDIIGNTGYVFTFNRGVGIYFEIRRTEYAK